MHDPLHVVLDIRRPPIFKSERRGRRTYTGRRKLDKPPQTTMEALESLPDFQTRELGIWIVRAKYHVCMKCEGTGRLPDREWEPGSCGECAGRGFKRIPRRRRVFMSGYQWRWGGREWPMPSVITIWHRDPETDGTDSSCRNRYARRGRRARSDGDGLAEWFWWWVSSHYDIWHVHHWRLQLRPWQAFKRWAFTRCAGCGERFAWGYSPVSLSWDGPRPKHWWQGEQGLYHGGPSARERERDCSTAGSLRNSWYALNNGSDWSHLADHEQYNGWLPWWRERVLGEASDLAAINAGLHPRRAEMERLYPEALRFPRELSTTRRDDQEVAHARH